MYDQWVLDCTLGDEVGYCFIPLEGDPHGEHSLVVGMNYISDKPPGKLIGVIHMDGQEACDEWCAAHESELAELFGKELATNGSAKEPAQRCVANDRSL